MERFLSFMPSNEYGLLNTANIAVIKSESEIFVYLLTCATKALSATQYVGHE